MDEITDSLNRALDRFDEFRAVQAGRSHEGDGPEPVTCLQEAVGIGDEVRELFRRRIVEAEREAPEKPGEVLFGLILGLLAAQFEAERRPTESSRN